MKKKLLSVLTALLMIVLTVTAAAAADRQTSVSDTVLSCAEDGKFVIMHISDIQDVYPMNETTKQFLKEVLTEVKPGLVILGGDNTVGSGETKAEAIKELCDIFIENGTYFTFVFGNHDHQQDVEKPELFEMYRQYGGEYCLAYEADAELTGTGTHNLLVKSSDGSKIVANLYMMDSNTYSFDENGNELGYDAVHEDELRWYKETSELVREQNGGETVPAYVFQHIIIQESYDKLFYASPVSLGALTENFDGKSYTYLPKVGGIENGVLLEKMCPGYFNYGQLNAMVETGDVAAIFSGHDHTNSFTVDCSGIKVINTPGCTFHSYGAGINRGVRLITIDENDPANFETSLYTVCEAALKEGSQIADKGEVTKAGAAITVAWGKFVDVFVKVLSALFFFQNLSF